MAEIAAFGRSTSYCGEATPVRAGDEPSAGQAAKASSPDRPFDTNRLEANIAVRTADKAMHPYAASRWKANEWLARIPALEKLYRKAAQDTFANSA